MDTPRRRLCHNAPFYKCVYITLHKSQPSHTHSTCPIFRLHLCHHRAQCINAPRLPVALVTRIHGHRIGYWSGVAVDPVLVRYIMTVGTYMYMCRQTLKIIRGRFRKEGRGVLSIKGNIKTLRKAQAEIVRHAYQLVCAWVN